MAAARPKMSAEISDPANHGIGPRYVVSHFRRIPKNAKPAKVPTRNALKNPSRRIETRIRK
jgi:hypothetical protein